MEKVSNLELLQSMISDGTFHHATYRNAGTVWEGLWVYKHDAKGYRGYTDVLCIAKDSPELDAAYKVLKDAGHGTSFGAYGCG